MQSELTSAQSFIVTNLLALNSRCPCAINKTTSTFQSRALRPWLVLELFNFTSTTGKLVCVCASTLGLSQNFPHLQEVALDGVDITFGLAVLGRCTDADAAVFDNVANTETVAGCRPKAELAKRRIAAVRCGQNGVVDLVVTPVSEDGW